MALTIEERIREIIAEQLGEPISKVKDESRFIEDLGMDSLDQIELVMALEEEYGFEIPDEDTDNLETVAQVIGYIKKKAGVV